MDAGPASEGGHTSTRMDMTIAIAVVMKEAKTLETLDPHSLVGQPVRQVESLGG